MISIIIPVYNAAEFLRTTVQSVLSQDYRDFEIILVDDGSTDKSGEICDNLAAEFNQISVVHKTNGGVSSARNTGIELARGEYLMFIDSDDEIDKWMLGDLVKEIEEKKADKVFCGFEEIHEDGTREDHIADLPPRKFLNRNVIIYTMIYTGCLSNSYMNSVCGGMYKTSIIKQNNLRFECRPMGEDWLFNMKYCDLIQSAVYIDKPYYKYLRNKASATSRYQPQQFELWVENRAFRKSLEERYKFEIESKIQDTQWIIKVMYYAIQVIQNDPDYKSKLIGIFKNKEFNTAMKNMSWSVPAYYIPVMWLLRHGYINNAIRLLGLYSKRIR